MRSDVFNRVEKFKSFIMVGRLEEHDDGPALVIK